MAALGAIGKAVIKGADFVFNTPSQPSRSGGARAVMLGGDLTDIAGTHIPGGGTFYGGFYTGSVQSPTRYSKSVSGSVTVAGVATANRVIFVYDHVTGVLIGRTISDGSGNWSLNTKGYTNVFAVALGDATYNALVYDEVTPG